jgi:hypothetical protein
MAVPGGERRGRASPERSSGGVFGPFLLANVLPIGALGFAAWKALRGEFPVEKLPKGLGAHLGAIALSIALLFVFARWSLPAVHATVRAAERGLKKRRRILSGEERGNRAAAFATAPFYAMLWAVSYPVRFVLIVLSLVLVAAVIVGVVRFARPDFVADYVPTLMGPAGG